MHLQGAGCPTGKCLCISFHTARDADIRRPLRNGKMEDEEPVEEPRHTKSLMIGATGWSRPVLHAEDLDGLPIEEAGSDLRVCCQKLGKAPTGKLSDYSKARAGAAITTVAVGC